MNCDRYEHMLPAFLEGDLTREDESVLNAHLSTCASCQESLAEYRELEDVLVARRDEVPSHEQFLQGVFASSPAPVSAANPALHRARVIMDAVFSVPGLAAVFSVVIAAMCFHYRDVIAMWLGRSAATTPQTSGVTTWLNQALSTYASDMTMVFIVYGVATVMVVAAGAWMTMRYLQD